MSFDPLEHVKFDATAYEAYTRAGRTSYALPPAYTPPPSATATLTEADVRRVVREELDVARALDASPLAVTPDEVRRWMHGRRP